MEDFKKIMLLFLLSRALVMTCGRRRETSSSSDTSSHQSDDDSDSNSGESIGSGARRYSKGRKYYEGMPVDFANRRLADNSYGGRLTKTRPAITTTKTTTTATTMDPPLDFRYRRIYNADETASIVDYPFLASVLVNRQYWCGAAIIGADRVITAAHCLQLQYNNRFFREYVKMLTVRVGSNNATSGGEILHVTEIFFHPNYKPQNLAFNFAILRLHKNMSFDSTSRIRAIAHSNDKTVPIDRNITFLGWGSVLGYDGPGGEVLLQKVTLPVYDLADCQAIYGRDLVTRNNFCAGYITIKKNVCNHDAGGPAIMDGELVGILSFSAKRCDRADRPAVFSAVGAVAPWIANVGQKAVPTRESRLVSGLSHHRE